MLITHSMYVGVKQVFVVITIYVDDLIVAGDSDVDVESVKNLLKQKIEMKDLGKLKILSLH